MNRQHRIQILFAVLALFAVAPTLLAGAWAVITLDALPDYAVAGKAMNLTFTVRQHGRTLLGGLRPVIRATSAAGLKITLKAAPATARGEYGAMLVLPEPGDWKITINSGFNDSSITLPALKVFAPGGPEPAPFSPATRGVRLFSAKGCVECHRHIEVNPERGTELGPDLTGKRFPQDYLKQFLANPSIKPAEMPNLNLKPDEIEALAAFINKSLTKQAR
jgi:hypothetical protein